MIKCKVEGCKKVARTYNSGFCVMHYFQDYNQKQMDFYMKKPLLKKQRKRRKAIINDMAEARLKLKARKL